MRVIQGTVTDPIYVARLEAGWDIDRAKCRSYSCATPPKPGPNHDGSKACESGSIASGGPRAHCTCDTCY